MDQTSSDARRSRLWLIGILVVVGSCMFSIVHLSAGLHTQLLGNRKMVRALKEQLVEEGKEREALLRDKDISMGKTSTLRKKSKLVTEELLEQQRKYRKVSDELLIAREDLAISKKNCTLSNLRMKNRYEVTLRALHDRVVGAEECRVLLDRNLEERAMLESSLVLMQDRAFNATKLLKTVRQRLKEALTIATAQRTEITSLKEQLGGKGGGSWFGGLSGGASETNAAALEQVEQSVAEEEQGEETTASVSTSLWKEYTDPKSGKKYWYNTETKKSQWAKPEELDM